MHRLEVIHELVHELRNRDFRQVTMRLVPNQPHREDVAQRGRDEMRILADEQLQAGGKILVGRHRTVILSESGIEVNGDELRRELAWWCIQKSIRPQVSQNPMFEPYPVAGNQ